MKKKRKTESLSTGQSADCCPVWALAAKALKLGLIMKMSVLLLAQKQDIYSIFSLVASLN